MTVCSTAKSRLMKTHPNCRKISTHFKMGAGLVDELKSQEVPGPIRITRKKTPIIFKYVISNHTLDSPYIYSKIYWGSPVTSPGDEISAGTITSITLQRRLAQPVPFCIETSMLALDRLKCSATRPLFVLWWNMHAQSGTLTHRRTSLSWRWFNANMQGSYSTTFNAPVLVVFLPCSTICSGHLSEKDVSSTRWWWCTDV